MFVGLGGVVWDWGNDSSVFVGLVSVVFLVELVSIMGVFGMGIINKAPAAIARLAKPIPTGVNLWANGYSG